MTQNWQAPIELRFVSAEPIPDRLFVCSARIKSDAGIPLKNAFETGSDLPESLKAIYFEHLVYTSGKEVQYYQAGPSADFSEVMYIFATSSLEEAQKLMRDDPFYRAGIFFSDMWFPWEVHSPYWKVSSLFREADRQFQASAGTQNKYPEGVKPPIEEIRLDILTPKKLFACFSKMDMAILKPWLSPESRTKSAIMMQHIYNCSGQGGAGTMGYHWMAGPSADYTLDLTIFSVNSLTMAQLIKENDAFSRYGIFYDIRYFEWCIHIPLRKASPQHREILKRFLAGTGEHP